jgi:excisionase family DNA binding protein
MNGFYRTDPGLPKASVNTPLSLRPREAAAALGISEKSLERLTKAGEIPSVLVGRCRLYEVDELKAYLVSRRASAGRAEA